MLTLYHGDTSVCSQKVRLVLYEKGLEWEGRFIDLGKGDQHTPEYLKLNPKAVVPTLVDDGKVVVESTMINEYLDDLSPEPPLRPVAPYERARMRLWVKQLDDTIHEAINTVTFAVALRHAILAQPKEAQEARIMGNPDPARREKMREILERGVEASMMDRDINRLDKMLADMETALGDHAYLAGDTYSLADAGFTPYVNRLAMLNLQPMWEAARPRVTDWYGRMKARRNYTQAILDHDPADRIAMMRASGKKEWPAVKKLIRAKA